MVSLVQSSCFEFCTDLVYEYFCFCTNQMMMMMMMMMMHLAAYMAVCQLWSFRASAETLSIFKSASLSYHQHTSPLTLTNRLLAKTTLGSRNAEKWGLSWLKQHYSVIFRHILTKRDAEVYTFLLNICVEFHAKICTHCWNINRSHRAGYFLRSPCSIVVQRTISQIGERAFSVAVHGHCARNRLPTELNLSHLSASFKNI